METKNKKIARLERELEQAQKTIAEYEQAEYEQAIHDIPADCVQGPWCKACAFHDVVRVRIRVTDPFSELVTFKTVELDICAKGRCANFTRKEEPDVD